MLVRFTVENFLSFRDRVKLSMVAGKTRVSPSHVVRPMSRIGVPLLKTAAIYGANASGKSNLIKAVDSLRRLVLRSVEDGRRIPFSPFRLDKECLKKPTRFELEMNIEQRIFAYGCSYNAAKILEEWLFEVGGEKEYRVFERTENSFESDIRVENEEQEQFLKFVAKGTPPNRLFLSECRERNVQKNVPGADLIFRVLDWFENRLLIIFPDTKAHGLVHGVYKSKELKTELGRFLKCFDTGIEAIDLESESYEKIELPPQVRQKIASDIEGENVVVVEGPRDVHWLICHDDGGKVEAWKMIARHKRPNGGQEKIRFEMKEESDGTRRLLDLIPAMIALTGREVVCLIDELDRSLHPDILHSYIHNFIKYSADKPSQLIVTTHDTTLLRSHLLRRDEVWFVEKGKDQSSRLVALEEFKFDSSLDLQTGYLQGRFGGVPIIQDFEWLELKDGQRKE